MMNRTAIEWCDYTWNPIVGCSPVSAGCENCYAAAIAKRFQMPWGKAVFMPDRLPQPSRLKQPSIIFTCSMSDIAHETISPSQRRAIYAAMAAANWHTYILLTKRPHRFIGDWPPPNAWVGVTIESAENMWRWQMLLTALPNFPVKFVSVEPMLGPVTFALPCLRRPDWVIAGPETGTKARPCDPAWIEALAAESHCFFDKRKTGYTRRELPLGATVQEKP